MLNYLSAAETLAVMILMSHLQYGRWRKALAEGQIKKNKKKLPLMSKNHFLYGVDTRVGIPILPHKEHPNFKIYNS